MIINLKTYLATLKQNEGSNVPSLRELAHSIGMNEVSFSRIANNKINQLTLEVGDKIIGEMRRRGFNMQVSDLLMYQDDSISQSVQN